MYDSLTDWCKSPITVKPFKGITGTGDTEYADPIIYSGYRVDSFEKITDKLGNEYVSRTQIYLESDAVLTESDMIGFPDTAEMYEIRKLNSYYEGYTGIRSIWVVYL